MVNDYLYGVEWDVLVIHWLDQLRDLGLPIIANAHHFLVVGTFNILSLAILNVVVQCH